MWRKLHNFAMVLALFLLTLVGLPRSIEFFAGGSQGLNNHGSKAERSTSTKTNKSSDDLVRVLFGASGDDPGFMSELEVALKSVLLNAPPDCDLEVHYMADKVASLATLKMLDRIDIEEWKMRNKLAITVHNTESYIEKWTKTIDDVWNHVNGTQNHFRHSVGAYFRLFAHQVLPKTVQHTIYMDSDVVILANLQELWRHIDKSNKKVFQWGEAGQCSGFMVFNIQNLPKLWQRVPTLLIDAGAGTNGDQRIMRTFNETYPKLVGMLPRQWDISAKNGYQGIRGQAYDIATPEEVLDELESAGMLHFNGGGASSSSYFNKKLVVKYDKTFGLARYYINMPWSWARFMVESDRRDDNFFLPTIESA